MNESTDYTQFSQEMFRLNEGCANKAQLTDGIVRTYFIDLMEFSLKEVTEALAAIRRNGSGFFPGVADIRRYILTGHFSEQDERAARAELDRVARQRGFRSHEAYMGVITDPALFEPPPPRALLPPGGHEPGQRPAGAEPIADTFRRRVEQRRRETGKDL